MHAYDNEPIPQVAGRWRVVLLCFLLIIGVLLVIEHRAHVLGYWPVALIAICPLLHLFLHGGGPGSHGNHARRSDPPSGGGERS
jgi:hypothetical protein